MTIIQTGDIDVALADATSFDAESIEMESRAKECAEILCREYPNHMWAVGWAPGAVLIVKHMLGDARYGFTIDNAAICSSSELRKACQAAGGELLERMGLPRRPWNGEDQPTEYQQ